MDLFETLGQALKPVEYITIMAWLNDGSEVTHSFIKGIGSFEIQSYLNETYDNCVCWETIKA